MNLDKYKWKNRIILIETPNYQNEKYKETKGIYEINIKEFHKRYIKLLTKLDKESKFNIKLIGFDGKVKKEFKKLNQQVILKLVDNMPMSKAVNPKNLSLFSDYNKETTVKGLGFKDKEKALHTLNVIKDKPLKYQVNVVATMLGRAKNHPHKTKEMDEAIQIFEKWLADYKAKKQNN